MSPRSTFGIAVALAAIAMAACSDASTVETADVTTTTTPTSTTAASDPPSLPFDETLYLDQGPGAPRVASNVPSTRPDGPIGRIGFTRYVYVNAGGEAIPSLVEGPVGQQIRCQQAALPCSYNELSELLASGADIPDELGLSEDELSRLVDELGLVQAAIERYPDADAACADGHEPDRTQTPNMGSHFTNLDKILRDGFDPANPEIIMFARVDGQAPDGPLGRCVDGRWEGLDVEPVGVAFYQPFGFVGDDHFEGFAGNLDNWHVHYNLCRLDGKDVTLPPSVCVGQGGLVGEPGDAASTTPQGDASTGWMIHAWADPAHDNQLGVFSMWNPSVWPVTDIDHLDDIEAAVSNRRLGTEIIDDFLLPDITLDAPGTVNFFNADGVAHTVTAGSAGTSSEAFDTGVIATRDLGTITVSEPGTYDYFCNLHPDMQATITVKG